MVRIYRAEFSPGLGPAETRWAQGISGNRELMARGVIVESYALYLLCSLFLNQLEIVHHCFADKEFLHLSGHRHRK
jgi:hypothetical protein